MTRAPETTRTTAAQTQARGAKAVDGATAELQKSILGWLDDAKAEEVVSIDIKQKSSIGDYMIVASGRSDRHVGAIADQLHQKLKEAGYSGVRVEGLENCDWVVVDAGAVIVHVFRPEVRTFYNIEKMWQAERPEEPSQH